MDKAKVFFSIVCTLWFGFFGLTVLLMLTDLCLSIYTGHTHNFPWQH